MYCSWCKYHKNRRCHEADRKMLGDEGVEYYPVWCPIGKK